MVGCHGAALNAVRRHLCGLRDRCIAAMLAAQARREGGVGFPSPASQVPDKGRALRASQ